MEGKDEFSRERESNVEKEEVGPWMRDEESERGEKERDGGIYKGREREKERE